MSSTIPLPLFKRSLLASPNISNALLAGAILCPTCSLYLCSFSISASSRSNSCHSSGRNLTRRTKLANLTCSGSVSSNMFLYARREGGLVIIPPMYLTPYAKAAGINQPAPNALNAPAATVFCCIPNADVGNAEAIPERIPPMTARRAMKVLISGIPLAAAADMIVAKSSKSFSVGNCAACLPVIPCANSYCMPFNPSLKLTLSNSLTAPVCPSLTTIFDTCGPGNAFSNNVFKGLSFPKPSARLNASPSNNSAPSFCTIELLNTLFK